MKILNQILKKISYSGKKGNSEISVSKISFDSRSVEVNDLFVAISGTSADGHKYIDQALSRGAGSIVCEHYPEKINPDVCYVLVDDSSNALAEISSAFYDDPSEKLKLIGVTGTNGKTSIATLLFRLTKNLGYRCGLLSTVENYINEKVIDATHTTPDPVQINNLLYQMVEAGCDYCFMEVSSHAIVQKRISGLCFAGGIFSNLTHDHLDYHKTFDNYLLAKQKFFDMLPSQAFALYNSDDRNGKILVQNTVAKKISYSLKSSAEFKCRIVEAHFDGMLLIIEGKEIWVKFIGVFNAYNLLAVYSTAILLNHDKDEVLKILSELIPVNGRFENIKSLNNITAIIDYAHTPDALKNVLETINEIKTGNEQIISVLGAGGNRDKTKRPVMGKIAAFLSNKVILTSDNPRFEKPEDIISQMYEGVEIPDRKKVLQIIDRREAIKTSVMISQPGDIILVAGKGHENYQEVNGKKTHFDDKEEIMKIFNEIK
ncbi:MAG: UDP-N-acetylmuramoyl-L-alanyl-D-glutamate--2,6-diaminopimelate ligase [Bacteroidota bacterium]